MQIAAEYAQEKNELRLVLASGLFDRSPNLELLLKYVCEKYFEGAADAIKEYNIAVEALGRRPGFDPKRDSIVRVEAHRLRKRLRGYYEAEGATHSVRIDIPSGQYGPQFVHQHPPQFSLSQEAVVVPAILESSAVPEDPNQAAPEETGSQLMAPAIHPISVGPAKQLLLPPPKRNPGGVWFFLSIAALALSAAIIWKAPAAKWGRSVPPIVAGTVPSASPAIRILAGLENGSYTDRLGRVWNPDRYFQGGTVFESAGHPIAAARDQRLFRSRREGAFSYDIPLPPGVYEMRLYFAETLYGDNNMAGGGETSRIFGVWANGTSILKSFDVIGEAGASTADIRAFKDISPAADGKLHLKFEPQTNPAMISAIEITPGTPGKMLPIHMVSREHPYTDKTGITWEADPYSHGGQLVTRTETAPNIPDPELLRGERYGNLTYVIPVPAGRYTATLYFTEAWFGPGYFAGGGAGSRIFDILCNGVAVRRGFDVFKEAHGSERAVLFPIHGLEPDPQGKITIRLSPVRNYALLNALEIVDEAK
jgi:hypothetical protein